MNVEQVFDTLAKFFAQVSFETTIEEDGSKEPSRVAHIFAFPNIVAIFIADIQTRESQARLLDEYLTELEKLKAQDKAEEVRM